MRGTFCYLILLQILQCSKAEQTNDDNDNDAIKKEIEAVAAESRSLAAELAQMLLRLEVQDLREEAVEAAVVGNDESVKEVLSEMVKRIQNIEDEGALEVLDLKEKSKINETVLRNDKNTSIE